MNHIVATSAIISLLIFALSPAVDVFLLSYGGYENVCVWIGVFFIIGFIAFLCYDAVLIWQCLFLKRDKTRVNYLLRIMVITLTLVLVIYYPPRTAHYMRISGARSRLEIEGGGKICEQLIKDAAMLTAHGDQRVALDDLPYSFRRIGGIYAYVQSGKYANINLFTCRRPIHTGWILVPENSSAKPEKPIILVKPGIYRY